MTTKCPKCGHTELRITCWQQVDVAFFEEDEDGADHEVIDGPFGDMEWDSDSGARCKMCDFAGTLSDFREGE